VWDPAGNIASLLFGQLKIINYFWRGDFKRSHHTGRHKMKETKTVRFLALMPLGGCNGDSKTEKHQKKRNHILPVREKVKEPEGRYPDKKGSVQIEFINNQ
jgi:hypothetical protein